MKPNHAIGRAPSPTMTSHGQALAMEANRVASICTARARDRAGQQPFAAPGVGEPTENDVPDRRVGAQRRTLVVLAVAPPDVSLH